MLFEVMASDTWTHRVVFYGVTQVASAPGVAAGIGIAPAAASAMCDSCRWVVCSGLTRLLASFQLELMPEVPQGAEETASVCVRLNKACLVPAGRG
jgi:hypothetical protein